MFRSFWLHDDAASGKDPELEIVLFGFHLKLSCEYESATSHGGNIAWAVIEAEGHLVLPFNGCDMDDGKLRSELLRNHLGQVTLFGASTEFPRSTLEEESMDIPTILWDFLHIIGISDVDNICLQAHVIEWELISSGGRLHDGSQERHWVEETGNPKGFWSDQLLGVLDKLPDSELEIIKPVWKRFEREVGVLDPKSWLQVEEHGGG